MSRLVVTFLLLIFCFVAKAAIKQQECQTFASDNYPKLLSSIYLLRGHTSRRMLKDAIDQIRTIAEEAKKECGIEERITPEMIPEDCHELAEEVDLLATTMLHQWNVPVNYTSQAQLLLFQTSFGEALCGLHPDLLTIEEDSTYLTPRPYISKNKVIVSCMGNVSKLLLGLSESMSELAEPSNRVSILRRAKDLAVLVRDINQNCGLEEPITSHIYEFIASKISSKGDCIKTATKVLAQVDALNTNVNGDKEKELRSSVESSLNAVASLSQECFPFIKEYSKNTATDDHSQATTCFKSAGEFLKDTEAIFADYFIKRQPAEQHNSLNFALRERLYKMLESCSGVDFKDALKSSSSEEL